MNGTILCVTHAGLISNLLMMLYDFEFKEAKPNPGEHCELEYQEGDFKLETKKNPFLRVPKDKVSRLESLKLVK